MDVDIEVAKVEVGWQNDFYTREERDDLVFHNMASIILFKSHLLVGLMVVLQSCSCAHQPCLTLSRAHGVLEGIPGEVSALRRMLRMSFASIG